MTHDNSFPVITKFMEMGATSVNDNRQVVMTLDHDVQNNSEQNLRKYRLIEEFANKQGIDFYPAKHGIGHQIMIEEGYAWPGTVTVASDSHSNIYGGVGCLGTAIVRSDAASVLATSTIFWRVPPVAKITFTGLFPVDETLISWYRARAAAAATSGNSTKDRINQKRIDELLENTLVADPGAKYAKEYFLDLSTLSPFVAGPNSVKVANPVEKLVAEDIAIDKAYLLSCTNGRSTDFAAAARVFREAGKNGKPAKVHPSVKLYLAPASLAEQRMSEEAGDWQVLAQSGAELLPAGCGACIGLGRGLLEEGEVGISASSPKALCYLASPEVVAASAIKGRIASPGWYLKPEGVEKVVVGEGTGDYVADKARSIEDAFGQIIGEMENVISAAEAEGAAGESASPPSH
ncbi:mitochondrial Homoaconitase [Fusarium solani]